MLGQYEEDPAGFVQSVLAASGKPYAKRAETFASITANRWVSVVGCNGSGKDWAAARIVLWWVETRARAKVILTGPTQRQVADVVWREMRTAYVTSKQALAGEMYASRYVVDDERFALGFATEHAYNLQGFHSPNLMVVLTEAHAVAQEHMNALKRLNPKRLLLTGNPLRLTGEFYDSHHRMSALYVDVDRDSDVRILLDPYRLALA